MRSSFLLVTVWMGLAVSCGAQAVTPELAHRIESMLRSKVDFAPATTIQFGVRGPSDFPGYDSVAVKYVSPDGTTGAIPLLVSKDGMKMAQFTSYDLHADPKAKFMAEGRPSRGGPVDAPVQIVGYDDLECPFCAQMNASILPVLLERYKDQVRVVYRSFPIEGHPWAMRAAIDVDCLAAQSSSAYWAAVDKIHAQFADYGGPQHLVKTAEEQIDAETRAVGKAFGVDGKKLDACVVAQDGKAEVESLRLGESLGVGSTPTLFINGLKVKGAVPLEFLFGVVDQALVAAGRVPPAKYVAPVMATQP